MFKYITMVTFLVVAANAVTLSITNKGDREIWIGIRGGDPPPKDGGFVLGSNKTTDVDVPDKWTGDIWARTWCGYNTRHCDTGDCRNKIKCNGTGPDQPVTLINMALKAYKDIDYYDLSLYDGFNTLATIEPKGGQSDKRNSCTKSQCTYHINKDCPDKLKLNSKHGTVGCKSACLAFDNDEYCCTGNKPCKSSNWPVDYAKFFKDRCPDAFVLGDDDKPTVKTCKNAPKYVITFGG